MFSRNDFITLVRNEPEPKSLRYTDTPHLAHVLRNSYYQFITQNALSQSNSLINIMSGTSGCRKLLNQSEGSTVHVEFCACGKKNKLN